MIVSMMVYCVCVTLLLAVMIYVYNDTIRAIKELEESIPAKEKAAREDALKKQRAVIKGQISEQVAPFMKGFPYSAADLKFFGNGFDYIAIDGMAEARDGEADIKEIIFIDIKTGDARLSVTQRKIRDCIARGDVAWETISIGDDGTVKIVRAKKPKEKTLQAVDIAPEME